MNLTLLLCAAKSYEADRGRNLAKITKTSRICAPMAFPSAFDTIMTNVMIKRLLAIVQVLALTIVWHSGLLLAEAAANQVEAIVLGGEQQSLSSPASGAGNAYHTPDASVAPGCMHPSHGTSGANCVVGTVTDEPIYGVMLRRHFAAWRGITDRLKAEAASLPLRPPILRS